MGRAKGSRRCAGRRRSPRPGSRRRAKAGLRRHQLERALFTVLSPSSFGSLLVLSLPPARTSSTKSRAPWERARCGGLEGGPLVRARGTGPRLDWPHEPVITNARRARVLARSRSSSDAPRRRCSQNVRRAASPTSHDRAIDGARAPAPRGQGARIGVTNSLRRRLRVRPFEGRSPAMI